MVKRFISLLLISICLGDILTLKDKSVYKGALVYYGNDEIIFKPLRLSEKTFISIKNITISIKDIKELKLSDGTTAFENGILKEPEEKIRQYIEMVILNHSQNDIREIINYFAVLFCIFVFYIGFKNNPPTITWPSSEWPEKGP